LLLTSREESPVSFLMEAESLLGGAGSSASIEQVVSVFADRL
jgi:hypothetical protein